MQGAASHSQRGHIHVVSSDVWMEMHVGIMKYGFEQLTVCAGDSRALVHAMTVQHIVLSQ